MKNIYKILVVEDNESMRLGIEETLKRESYSVESFDNGVDALGMLDSIDPDIAIVDLKMEPIGGLEVLKEIKREKRKVQVMIISAYGKIEDAVEAMKNGASDYLTKPFSPEELRIKLKNLINLYEKDSQIEKLVERNELLTVEIESEYQTVIGNSDEIKKDFQLIDQVAKTDSTVLLTGESGTGKELVAREIHKRSSRSDKAFIKVNCGALNENLLESELFGHVKGAFTGAHKDKKGRFELAHEGSLFLDEIGDVSPAMQLKLLRVLQEGEFERVGGEKTLITDVRIISATNKDLQKLIKEGKFREDLFYRLSVVPISLPPLRERKEDILLFVDHFINKKCNEFNIPVKKISEHGYKTLSSYSYPGNIRELENLIERLIVISSGDEIDDDLIYHHIPNGNLSGSVDYKNIPLDKAVNSFEKNLIIDAMNKANGVKNRAAKLLGIKTNLLYYKLEKYGLS